MDLYFIRHGETDWNKHKRLQGRQDVPLNDKGLAQAKMLAIYLKKEKIDRVISSPLQRAKTTADTIAASLQLPVSVDPLLIERSFGQAEGMTFEQYSTHYPDGIYPEMERTSTIQARCIQLIENFSTFKEKKIVIVSHGELINNVLDILSQGTIKNEKLNNGSISHIKFTDDHWKIMSYNQSPADLLHEHIENECQDNTYIDQLQFLREKFIDSKQAKTHIIIVKNLYTKSSKKIKFQYGLFLAKLYRTYGLEDASYFPLAKDMLTKCFNFAQSSNENDTLIETYMELGELYKNMNNYNLALNAFAEALNLATQYTNKDALYLQFGKCYFECGNLNQAENYFYRSLDIRKEKGQLTLLEETQQAIDLLEKQLVQA